MYSQRKRIKISYLKKQRKNSRFGNTYRVHRFERIGIRRNHQSLIIIVEGHIRMLINELSFRESAGIRNGPITPTPTMKREISTRIIDAFCLIFTTENRYFSPHNLAISFRTGVDLIFFRV